ncbi:MAG: serine O-acetyltransferase [Candidatus Eisenbacteria bacterium]|uniref:Serine acetyltransferase n=1 Tax=Eiseniibacteriota bacterium TaxID=2212470 RepID=A0A933SBC9_UNCEI|nr:serine O-acetyltransferase [Candidatus Eisenbacteria bacterium]
MTRLLEDLRTIRRKDPAARNVVEILLCYPGLHAQWFHRLAHALWRMRVPVLPRLVSHVSRFLTGIEIHPGATLGRRVFIDHGMGVVIGETAVVGDDCLIYQGVTLGGTSLSPGKRHPTLESHVVVGSGAKVLGDITLGAHSRVGSGSVVIKSCPPHSTVVGIPGRVLEDRPAEEQKPGHELEHARLPDPTARAITALHDQVGRLAREIAELRQRPVELVLPRGASQADIEAAFRSIREGEDDARATAMELVSGAGI